MTKDTFLGYLRSAMAIIGSLLIGKVIFGIPIVSEVIDSVIGGGMFVASVIWGVFDKTATEEQISSALFKLFTLVGGILLAKGIITQITLTAILGIVPLLAAEIVKRIINSKDQKVATGIMPVMDTKGAQTAKKQGEIIAPVVKALALLFIISAIGLSAHAQFFKPEKKPTQKMMAKFGATGVVTQNVIRPVANIASYAIGGSTSIGLTGAGISWQHQEWNDADQRWKVLYSANVMTWYGTDNQMYYGAAAGALNNMILIGVCTHDGKRYLVSVGFGININ